MAIKWSPGCGCCESVGCDEFAIGFTPTTEQDREGYAAWTNFTEYLKDDEFSHYSNNDGWTYLYRVPMTLFSGSGWTSFEESRYTRVRRVDVANELDEWHLYGDGWNGLTPSQLDAYLRNGRLSEDMGYLSKADVLPSVESWRVNFNYSIPDVRPPASTLSEFAFQGSNAIVIADPLIFAGQQEPFNLTIGFTLASSETVTVFARQGNLFFLTSPLQAQYQVGTPVALENPGQTGLRLQTFSQMELDGSNDPDSYFSMEQTWISENDDPIGTEIDEFGVIPGTGFTAITKIPPIRNETKVTTRRVVAGSPTDFDVGYITRRQVSMCRGSDISGGELVSTVFPGVDSLQSIDAARNECFLVVGDGVIAETISIPEVGLDVFDGDLIKLIDTTDKTLLSSWEIIRKVDITLTDVLGTLDNFENPDPQNELTGRKVGLYVANGLSRPFDVSDFQGVIGSRTRSIERIECPTCSTKGPICYGETEHPIFVTTPSSGANLLAFDSFVRDQWSPQYPFANSVTFHDLGVATRRRGTVEFEFAHVAATVFRSDKPQIGIEWDAVLFAEKITATFDKHSGFETEIISTATMIGWLPIGESSVEINAATLIADGWPKLFWATILPTQDEFASGRINQYVPSESFSCDGFVLQGTYTSGRPEVDGYQWSVMNA